ncbi:MAG: 5-formyltetrahydrofolate cyclo-ligase [Trichloromonas sp.]|jgi:5-formyltetrahydrofolate cyclo-ligase|nr:5-formyltetrahydrofolate cyclo-ligase [Trichloromonas sp.]
MPKQSLRAAMLERRRISTADRAAWGQAAQSRLLSSPEYAAANFLALYSPVRDEVPTDEIFRAARKSGKRVAYPRVAADGLEFVEVSDLNGLRPGRFGILEPIGASPLPLAAIDLMVIPGVAYDLEGFRLGYGKGCYDRFLHGSGAKPRRAGFCYELQLVASLPVENHDIAMHLLITESRILRFAPQFGDVAAAGGTP